MLQNAYSLAKIGVDTAEKEQHFAEIRAEVEDGFVELRVRLGLLLHEGAPRHRPRAELSDDQVRRAQLLARQRREPLDGLGRRGRVCAAARQEECE